MKEFVQVPFRPYVHPTIAYVIGRCSEALEISRGDVLTALLQESKTFKKILENEYAADEELKKIFLCISFEKKKCNNSEKKEIR